MTVPAFPGSGPAGRCLMTPAVPIRRARHDPARAFPPACYRLLTEPALQTHTAITADRALAGRASQRPRTKRSAAA